MQTKWEYYSAYDADAVRAMMREFRVPRAVARVLFNRGIIEKEDVWQFLHPKTDYLLDAFLLKDMSSAVGRVIRALREREKILIYGDYDVDGITAVSMLYLFLKDLGGEVAFYIPDRSSEGYGLSIAGIEEASKLGCSLIISVDCGITSVEEVEHAHRANIDVIISDHHEPGEQLPSALAVLDPKRPDDEYPFKELAGVGVAYKLAQGVVMQLGLDVSYLEKYLDLVAIGSAADIVPLIGENRVFVKIGLEKLNKQGQEGLTTLIRTAGLHLGAIDVGQIIYGLAPRINAVGRLGHAQPAVDLLITRNQFQAQKMAAILEEENRHRKEIDTRTLHEALNKIEREYDPDSDYVIVLSSVDWHPGVIGIVASRIIEKFYRPTVMITIEGKIGKGSARSIPNFDLHSALKACSDLFLQFGGHKYAAGLTIYEERIPEFKRRFNEVAKSLLQPEDLIPKIKIDDEIEIDELNTELVRMLGLLAPFGPRNSRPCFVTSNLEIFGQPRVVGTNHLKFRVRKSSILFDAIAFNRADDAQFINNGDFIDLVYYIEENNWMDRNSLQMKVRDFRPADTN